MRSFDGQEQSTIADLLGQIRGKGVRLWPENGRLRYAAPRGALSEVEIQRLCACRAEILALLETAASIEPLKPTVATGLAVTRAPLAFSQLSHWYLYHLHERRSVRQIASAIRIRGPLNLEALRQSAAEVVRRHDALRTQIVVHGGTPMQRISATVACELLLEDISSFPDSERELEVISRIERFVLRPISVDVDPLFGLLLLRLREEEHVLVVAMEHMISDMVSLDIVLRELIAGYGQARRGEVISLPAVAVQFPEYALWQRNAEQAWRERHARYWTERLAVPSPRMFLKETSDSLASDRRGWGTVPVRIAQHLKAELCEWSREQRTTLVMAVFTAYVALVLRWCNVSDGLFRFQVDGRAHADVANTIGYFAMPLYLRVALLESDNFLDLTRRITQEYCAGYEHADSCCLEAQVPRPDFARCTAFNWLPRKSGVDIDGPQDAIVCSAVEFSNPLIRILEWDSDPAIVLAEVDDEVVGGFHFPLSNLSVSSMEKFAGNLLPFIAALLRAPEGRVNDLALLR